MSNDIIWLISLERNLEPKEETEHVFLQKQRKQTAKGATEQSLSWHSQEQISSTRGKEIALNYISIKGVSLAAMPQHQHLLAISFSCSSLPSQFFCLLTNKDLMKCTRMKDMEVLGAGRTKSHTSEISESYAAHLTLWKWHSFRSIQLDRRAGKKKKTKIAL